MEHFRLTPKEIDELEVWQFEQCVVRLDDLAAENRE